MDAVFDMTCLHSSKSSINLIKKWLISDGVIMCKSSKLKAAL